MTRSTLRWLVMSRRWKTRKKFVKKLYFSGVEGPSRRGRPLGGREDRVKEYMSEREVRGCGLEQARRECMQCPSNTSSGSDTHVKPGPLQNH